MEQFIRVDSILEQVEQFPGWRDDRVWIRSIIVGVMDVQSFLSFSGGPANPHDLQFQTPGILAIQPVTRKIIKIF